MVTITDETLGTFEGEDERAAAKKLRRARAAARKAEKLRATRRSHADLKARAAAYRLHEWAADVRSGERERAPRAIQCVAPVDSYSCTYWPREFGRGHAAAYDTDGGRVEVDHHGYYVDRVIEGGSGFTLAIILNDCERPIRRVYAIGVHEGEWILVPVSLPAEEIEQACE